MSREIERFIIGHIHTVVYESEVDSGTEYVASFEPDPNDCAQGCYTEDLLGDLARAASAASLIIRCAKGQLNIMDTSEQLVRYRVIRSD